MDSSLQGCRTNERGNSRGGQFVKNGALKGPGLTWIVAIGIALVVSSMPAFGQFTVQPMKVELQIRPGRRAVRAIEIQSLDPNNTHILDLSVVDLTQNVDGGWQIIEPNEDLTDPNSSNFGIVRSKLASCRQGLKLNLTSITLGPNERLPVEINLAIPRTNSGFLCAGIVVAVRPRVDAEVAFVLRYMVPVLVEIEGRARRSKVTATDMGLEFIPAVGQRPATTLLTLNIQNDGMTFPRVRPVARIWSWSAGHWRVIKTTAFQDIASDIGIIPGAKLELKTDLKKALPRGKYKIAGVPYVDGKRTRRVEKEIDFIGDPSVTTVAADTPLDLRPEELMVECRPGATRSQLIEVYNGSNETVNIVPKMELPRGLANKVVNGVIGMDMDCTSWTKIEPAQFTLRGEGGLQKLRITTSVPESATKHPCYYSNLNLWASYPDGQNAGVTTAKVCVQNPKLSSPIVAGPTKLRYTDFGGSKYLVIAEFGNYGFIHFKPNKVKAAVTMIGSTVPRASTLLTSTTDKGLMLPFEERDFSGVLDFSALPADQYVLSVAMEHTPGQWTQPRQMAIQVSLEGDRRVVRTIGTHEELKEPIQVQWGTPR
ncbi:MAG: hypothetical protein CEE38_00210 [Planctomycetes bacterium B3_Pla]|nr:MAG: hypothetical protein CEE38_00210 [Planctomycetes bacterium B3_Pla]